MHIISISRSNYTKPIIYIPALCAIALTTLFIIGLLIRRRHSSLSPSKSAQQIPRENLKRITGRRFLPPDGVKEQENRLPPCETPYSSTPMQSNRRNPIQSPSRHRDIVTALTTKYEALKAHEFSLLESAQKLCIQNPDLSKKDIIDQLEVTPLVVNILFFEDETIKKLGTKQVIESYLEQMRALLLNHFDLDPLDDSATNIIQSLNPHEIIKATRSITCKSLDQISPQKQLLIASKILENPIFRIIDNKLDPTVKEQQLKNRYNRIIIQLVKDTKCDQLQTLPALSLKSIRGLLIQSRDDEPIIKQLKALPDVIMTLFLHQIRIKKDPNELRTYIEFIRKKLLNRFSNLSEADQTYITTLDPHKIYKADEAIRTRAFRNNQDPLNHVVDELLATDKTLILISGKNSHSKAPGTRIYRTHQKKRKMP